MISLRKKIKENDLSITMDSRGNLSLNQLESL